MKEKLEQLMKAEREMPRIRFAELLDIQPATLSHIMSDRNKPSRDLLIKILDTFPNVSAEWLMRSKGEMLIDSNCTPTGLPLSTSYMSPSESTTSGEQLFSRGENSATLTSRTLFGTEDNESGKSAQSPSQELQQRRMPSSPIDSSHKNSVSGESHISEQLPLHNFLSQSQTGSLVERIVVFYADKSFETYTPKR